ncbi:MAG TPA: exonuclease domain-containing protein [Spirochaetota bacterium]|nr:exonuclease domain-containing protein [Spirochaetota bacterium]HPS86272.1 exonuclease domain-containing protein [Spirochaetota bacterium]
MVKNSVKLSSIDFCAVDLETTGVNPAFDKIVEIGAVRFKIDGGNICYQSLVNPGVHIPENVIRIHGITDKMVSDSPALEDIRDDFFSFIDGTVLVIQNPRFDLSFIDRAFGMSTAPRPELLALDTVRLAKKYFTGLPNHKLPTLAAHLGLELVSHRALDDAIACMAVFCETLKGFGLTGESTFSDLIKIHGDLVRPGIESESSMGAEVWRTICIGEEVTIRYIDSDGNITVRQILPKEFLKYGKNHYILAHCFLRDSERCFMTSRIMSID